MKNMQIKEGDFKETVWNVKRISIIAIFIALSAVGALIKIPSPVGTIGIDSAPGYFAALAFGGLEGMIVISIGHLLTSAVVGFPLSIPLHLAIATLMALWALVFRIANKQFGIITAVIAAIFLNGVVSSVTVLPVGGLPAALGLIPFLVIGSGINIIIAAIAYKMIKKSNLI